MKECKERGRIWRIGREAGSDIITITGKKLKKESHHKKRRRKNALVSQTPFKRLPGKATLVTPVCSELFKFLSEECVK